MSASPLGQVRVELTRLRWRRAILLLLVAAVVLPALLLAGTAWSSRPMSDAEVDSLLADRFAQREVTRCERQPQNYTEVSTSDPDACRELIAGWYGGRQPLSVQGELDDGLLAASTLVLLLLLLAGTTFVGHDWNTGSMSNQLLFEPRRGRVWATKATALVLVAGLLGTAVLAAYWSGLLGLAASRDLTVPDGVVTKSNLILGMGETREEVSQALVDLHAAGCELITITQYLRPSLRHHPVERWVKPEEFVELAAEAEEIGFSGVMSGPLVRSSYRAGRLYRQAMDAREGAAV